MLKSISRQDFLPYRFITSPNAFRAFTNQHLSNADEEDLRRAREWLRQLHADTIPHSIGEISFSRSSGPGGQNVNKVNSKATLHVPLEKLRPHVPLLFIDPLRGSRYYKRNSDSLVFQTDDSRKQADNARGSFVKLHELIRELGIKCVPGETSDAKKERVKVLAKASDERRLREKKVHSSKKGSRKGGKESRDDY